MSTNVLAVLRQEERAEKARQAGATAQCKHCRRSWRSYQECHCTAVGADGVRCCAHFTGEEAWYLHRSGDVGSRRCGYPATAVDSDGELLFEPVETAYGVAYRRRRVRTAAAHWAANA